MILSKLDKVFSEYIRRRDADENGYVKCCTCPNFLHWKEMDCGHWMKRRHMATRFNEQNCHAQCQACNRDFDGRDFDHMNFIKRKYGLKVIGELIRTAHINKHFMQHEIDELVEYYKQKLKTLIKKRDDNIDGN